jgi:hypothetical protein
MQPISDAGPIEIERLRTRVAELEAELKRVAPFLAMHGVEGYRLETDAHRIPEE